jgi:hypothetical protein
MSETYYVIWKTPWEPIKVTTNGNIFAHKTIYYVNLDGILYYDGTAIIELGKSAKFYKETQNQKNKYLVGSSETHTHSYGYTYDTTNYSNTW